MALDTDRPTDDQTLLIRVPSSLSIKDLITIIVASVSLALAWGVFSTRLTVIENEINSVKQVVSSQSVAISELNRTTDGLRDRQNQTDIFVDQLYDLMQKAPPRRRGL